ncbi:20495_t:CDS:1, partial [Cetraspora pellucida]
WQESNSEDNSKNKESLNINKQNSTTFISNNSIDSANKLKPSKIINID